jgi:uncharacterized protein YciI
MQRYQTITTVCLLAFAPFYPKLAADENRDYFVFLTTGKSTQGIAPEVVAQKQAAHLANFGRLAKLGSLTIAGPCADPDKKTRGIVVVHADSIADAESKFGPDPYVSEGFMKAELHPFQTVVGKLKLVTEDITMEQIAIAIASRGKKWKDKSQDESIAADYASFAKKQFEAGKLGFAAQFTDKSNNDSGRVAVMIFRDKDVEFVKKTLESSELVRDEKVSVQVFPQYMAKGAIE